MTERQRSLLWKKTQARRDRFTRAMGPRWKAALLQQIQPVMDEISEATLYEIEGRIQALITEDQIKDVYEYNFTTVAAFFAADTFAQVAKAMGDSWVRKAGGIPTSEDWILMVSGILYDTAGERITSITMESKDQLLKIIQAALLQAKQDNLGASQTAQYLRDRLREDWGYISTYRAARISRTETTAASNLGSVTGAKASGLPMDKVWLSSRDSRTRRRGRGSRYGPSKFDHYGKFPSGPDGERVDMDEKFTKTGEPLDYPGDYSGSAGNVIHCRCTQYFEPKGEITI